MRSSGGKHCVVWFAAASRTGLGLCAKPAAAALSPKPRNYRDGEWQKSVTDEQLKETIVGGGVAVGKSSLMTPNPDLAGKDELVDGLVKIIRGFAPKC